MHFYWFLLGTLAVWRIVHLLNAEDGPFDLLLRLRRLAGAGFWGGLLDCFYCLSVWVAVPFAWFCGESWSERLLLWPALSGAAILVERLTLREERLHRQSTPKTKGERMCCGKGRSQFRGGMPTPPSHSTAYGSAPQPLLSRYAGVGFEYVGRTGLTVTGPVTGRQYRFDRPGVRVEVDPRDQASIAAIPVLRQVR